MELSLFGVAVVLLLLFGAGGCFSRPRGLGRTIVQLRLNLLVPSGCSFGHGGIVQTFPRCDRPLGGYTCPTVQPRVNTSRSVAHEGSGAFCVLLRQV